MFAAQVKAAIGLRVGCRAAILHTDIPMPPYLPKYVRPADAALSLARLKRRLTWIAIAIPLVFMFLAFGYSDQAPAFLRGSIIAVDRAFGYPIIGLLSMILG